ncbi:flagellar motor switch protein FliM [Christensenella intestinihominis]|uniref:flagellar motor switch protein FliM n=1 Tax=Christensenella intestinihominis TaxID=1851429 RepID=UPI00082F9507|nr:flagellar motor switch protein FliM [Christensenella intestinihominis]
MSDILSQNEIDALLNALNAGEDIPEETPEAQPNAARLYDFRTANKFYREQMRTLNVVFDSFSYLLTNKLTGLLHTVCSVEVISVEEQSFGEFNNSLPTPVILGVIDMDPFQGSLLMELSSSLVYALISRLFGGEADYSQNEKSFTEIEMSLIENIMHQMMGVMKDAWGKIVSVEPIIKTIESSSQFTQIAAMNEPAAIITMNAKIDNIEGIIALCIPHYAIQPVAKQLSTVNWTLAETQKQNKGPNQEKTIEEQLQNTYVTIEATFNETATQLGEILRMQVGDVICLNHPIKECINLSVESIPKFRGVVGTDHHKYAVQIAKIIKENENIE